MENVTRNKVSGRLLERLKTAHKFYAEGMENEERVLKAMEPTIKILSERYDVEESFCYLYILYGNWFLSEEFGCKTIEEWVKMWFVIK